MINTINPLSLDDLMARKDEVVEAHNEAMNDLEQKYFSDVTQLYRIKQAMQCQLQTSLMDSLNEINNMIKAKMRSQGLNVSLSQSPRGHNNNSLSRNASIPALGANHHSNNNGHHNGSSVISISSGSQQSTNSHFHHNHNGHRSHSHPHSHSTNNRLMNPPTFSRPLPIASMPQIQAPTVPLSTSIDHILHKKSQKRGRDSVDHDGDRDRPSSSSKKGHGHKNRRKRRKMNGSSSSHKNDHLMDTDPMSLDFNLVTVPDDTLNDVRSIVANNASKLQSNHSLSPRSRSRSISRSISVSRSRSPSHSRSRSRSHSLTKSKKKRSKSKSKRSRSKKNRDKDKDKDDDKDNHNHNRKSRDNRNKSKQKKKSNNSSDSNNSNSNNREKETSPSSEPSLGPTVNIKQDKDTKEGIKDEKDIKPDTKELKPDTLECDLCHQAFDTEKNLQAHRDKAHTFKCDLCTKSFQKRIDLKRHQRLHEGVTVYEWYVISAFFPSLRPSHGHKLCPCYYT